MKDIYYQILIKHKLNDHQYLQSKYDNFFLVFNFYLINDIPKAMPQNREKRKMLTVSVTRNIRDAVASKLLAAVQQATA